MRLTNEAREALAKGHADGTIKDTEEQIIETVLKQEVVSYCSSVGTYTFDYMDVVEQTLIEMGAV